MFVVKYRKIFFLLSAILIALSLYGIFAYGFNESIDFKGGTITEVKYTSELYEGDIQSITANVESRNLGGLSIRTTGTDGLIIRTKELSEAERASLMEGLKGDNSYQLTVERQNTIGPVAGQELKSKAFKAVVVVVLMIVLFVTFAFRKVSQDATKGRGVSSWKYGFATIIALAHDVIIPTGVFVFLGHFLGIEIDLLFVTGLLAILGYSVHDTIVVFDRVRENLKRNDKEDFETLVGKSVHQTFGRSINTSLTIFITLLALYLFGAEATKDFALLLIVGVVVGTYSSIFVASPLLVTFKKWQKK